MTNKKRKTDKQAYRPVLKTQYTNYEQVEITFDQPTQTQQNFKDECDINNVMARFQRTGEVPGHLIREAKYGVQPPDDLTHIRYATAQIKSDFENIPDEEKGDMTLDQYLAYRAENDTPEITADSSEGEAEVIQEEASDSAQEEIEAENT